MYDVTAAQRSFISTSYWGYERRQYVYPRQGAGSPPRVKELTERKDIRVVSRQQAVRCRDGVAYIVIRELSFLYDNTPCAALLSPLLF